MSNPRPSRPHLFQKGVCPNPGGRPGGSKEKLSLAQAAREHTQEALDALVRGLSDPKQYVSAAIALLDRGWGKPHQAVALSGQVQVTGGIDAPIRPATPEDAEAWLARRRAELAALAPPSPPH